MDSSLFHLDPDGLLSPVVSQGFSSHGELQGLIADHPGLIGDGDGWFSISREGSAGASGWSSEHLFLSRDGVPAIVETSLAADTGAGGELVGRILYGAASAASWWPAGAVREAFAATAGGDPDVALGELIGTSRAASAYWAEVERNLGAGRLRMILVVDEIRPELTRVADFLGAQLRDTALWILEIKQNAAGGSRLLTTTLVGREPHNAGGALQTLAAAPAARKAAAVGAAKPPTTRQAWVAAVRAQCDADEAQALDDLLRWMSEQYGATEVTAAPTPSFQLTVKESGVDRVIFGISHAKNAELRLKSLSTSLAYGGVDSRQHLIEEVLTAGLPVGAADPGADLRIPLKVLARADMRGRLLNVLDGVIETLRLKQASSAFMS